MIQPPLALADRHEVDHGLAGMRVPTVACIDHRHTGRKGCPQRCALFGVAHGDHIGVVAHHAGGVLHRLALAGGRKLCPCKAQYLAAQPQHGRFKRKAGAGGRLIEQCGQALAVSYILVCFGVIMDAVRKIQQLLGFFLCKVKGINQMSHQQPSFPYGVSENKENDGYFAKTSRI